MSLTRRSTLRLLATTLTSAAVPRVVLAAAPTERRLVLIILRGALDGLAAVPPFFDPAYRQLRTTLGPGEPGSADGALDLDGGFALHPSLRAFHAMYKQGDAAIIHAVATPYRERSHFDAQDLLENGTLRARGATDGWLNRALGLMPRSDTRVGLAVGQTVPLVMRGTVPVGSWAAQTMPELNRDFLSLLSQVYKSDTAFDVAFTEGMRAHAMNDEVLGDEKSMGGNARGAQAIRATTSAIGKLLASADGPRVAALDIGGWDTHSAQNARLKQMLQALDDGLTGLRESLGAVWRQSVVVVATEFGRTAQQNGTNGTDHGTGSVVLLAGGAVAGGKVLGHWPGLAADKLHQGRDLAPTTDMRAVFKTLLLAHVGLPRDGIERAVFPDSRDVRALDGLVKA